MSTLFQSLRSKLVFILAAAVFPAIGVSAFLAVQSYQGARAQAETMFHQNSRIIVKRLQGIMIAAGSVATAHAQDRDIIAGSSLACGQKLARMVPIYAIYSGLAVIDANVTVCEAGTYKLLPEDAQLIRQRLANNDLAFGRLGKKAGADAFWAGARSDVDGRQRIVVVVVDEPVLAAAFGNLEMPVGTITALSFDSDQSVISIDGKLDPQIVQDVRAASNDGKLIVDRAVGQKRFLFAVHDVEPLGLHLIVGAPRESVLMSAERQLLLAIMAPLALFLFAVLTIWLSLDKLVLRWILKLRETAIAYAGGNLDARCGNVADAPIEFQQFCGSFDMMADNVADRTHQLERENSEKNRYIRELHHRVKNNLQVIASLLALQKRSLPDDQKAILRFPEDRVNAMSAAYRVAYAHSEAGRVDIAVVLHEVVSRLETAVSTGRPNVKMEFDTQGHQVDLDTAIPIAMLLAEIVPAIFDKAASSSETVDISAGIAGPNLMIEIVGDHAGPDIAGGLSRRFVSAYMRQLSASYEVEDGRTMRIQVPLKTTGAAPDTGEANPL